MRWSQSLCVFQKLTDVFVNKLRDPESSTATRKNKQVHKAVDSTTTTADGGQTAPIRGPAMMSELRKLFLLTVENDIRIRTQYIRSAANIWADKLSRETDTSDW